MTESAVPATPNNKRKSLLLILAAVFLLVGVGAAWHWWVVGQFQETTDNAYVGGNLIPIMPRREGTVVKIYAGEMDPVREGQSLVALEDADARATSPCRGTSSRDPELRSPRERGSESSAGDRWRRAGWPPRALLSR